VDLAIKLAVRGCACTSARLQKIRTFNLEAQGWHSIEQDRSWSSVIALPVALAVFLLLAAAITHLTGSNPIQSILSIEAVLWLVALIPLHELLHVFAQPGGGLLPNSLIGVWVSRAVIYASYLGTMSRARFVICLAAPFVVLTLLPLLLMMLKEASLNGEVLRYLGLLSLLNGVASAGDLVGLGLILAQVPRAAILQDKGWANLLAVLLLHPSFGQLLGTQPATRQLQAEARQRPGTRCTTDQ
jgi:hypothetical protein